MKRSRINATAIVVVAALFFVLPLVATLLFSLSMKRGVWSLEAYRVVFADSRFVDALTYSLVVAIVTILLGALLVVPSAYWVRLRFPRLRPLFEFLSLLPLVIPPIVLVFGYIRFYNSSSILPLTASETGTNVLLVLGYVALSLPYMYRAVDTGMAAVDIRTLTEAAESLGAGRRTILMSVIFPNVRASVLSGAFITFAIVMGEFVFASLLNRDTFGPYLALIGQNRAYEPSALAFMAFLFTWTCMGMMQLFARRRPRRRRNRRPFASPSERPVA
ncbi:ABC transporter permease [Pararhizobium mangrovi]|uniref:ABC transporter permease n=1 Tax=Pararhizobium mangrovi TaxID=2590452 RepID=A0A506UA95_9HYPH|nr:ABC transporter permease [Pararhizobium mangrovi]TPW30286.1 ABC transporter permease [Pararhizobium mangrovi]